MWPLYPVSIDWGEDNYVINGVRTPIWQIMLNETDPFPYKYCTEQPLPFLLGVLFFVNGATMNVADNNLGSC